MESLNTAVKHFLQFVDKDQNILEVQVPAMFEHEKIGGITQFGEKWVLLYRLKDGTLPMIPMPEEYTPERRWQFGGYRRDPA